MKPLAIVLMIGMSSVNAQVSDSQQSVPSPAPVGRADESTGVTVQRERMRVLAPIVGRFSLTAGELATDDSMFKEAGTRECQWIFDESAILCEDSRQLLEASGRYTQLASHRRSVQVYRWNAEVSGYERVAIGVTGAPDVRPLTFDAATRTLSYPFVVNRSSYLGETLDSTSVTTIAADGHDVSQTLRSRTSDFVERYREIATRVR